VTSSGNASAAARLLDVTPQAVRKLPKTADVRSIRGSTFPSNMQPNPRQRTFPRVRVTFADAPARARWPRSKEESLIHR
jgi:hypothetical protein